MYCCYLHWWYEVAGTQPAIVVLYSPLLYRLLYDLEISLSPICLVISAHRR